MGPSGGRNLTSDMADPVPKKRIATNRYIWVSSVGAGVCVLGLTLLLQWLIYDDWLRDNGPLRVVGSGIAGVLTFAFAYVWQQTTRRHRLQQVKRSEEWKQAEDRVRNSLQTIECVTYALSPDATEPVRDAVDAIERTLEDAFRPGTAIQWPKGKDQPLPPMRGETGVQPRL